MKVHGTTTFCIIIALILLLCPINQAKSQTFASYQYSIQIRNDGSAAWVITQVSDINATVDSWDNYTTKIYSLVNNASAQTHREMSIDENSLEINSLISTESKTTTYKFIWQNFSVIQNEKILIGDVFEVPNFFGHLYGDAQLTITYLSPFSVKSATPQPYDNDNTTRTMRWQTTYFLVNGKLSIILENSTAPTSNSGDNNMQVYLILGAISVSVLVLAPVAFYFSKRRKLAKANVLSQVPSHIENDDEKILSLIKQSGGSMRQSDITEQCKFSKAKVSQLLADLEKRGIITRYKSGRDKIVALKKSKGNLR